MAFQRVWSRLDIYDRFGEAVKLDTTVSAGLIAEAVEEKVNELLPLLRSDSARFHAGKYKRVLRIVLVNLYKVSLSDTDHRPQSLACSRNNNSATREGISVAATWRVASLLEAMELLESCSHPIKGYGLPTLLKPSLKFLPWLVGSQTQELPLPSYKRPGRPLVLRDDEKREVPYVGSDDTKRMAELVEGINALFAKTKFALDGKHFPTPFLRRIFNGSFHLGGRFYGLHQQLPKSERANLTIAGEPVVEFDISNIHLRLAYFPASVSPPDQPDLYALPQLEEHRDLVKLAVSIAWTSSSKHKACYTVVAKGLKKEGLASRYRGLTIKEVAALYDRIASHHSAISSLFFTGQGRHLQYLDSVLAASVMEHFLHRGIVVLPVHDSFIVSRNNADELECVVKEKYAALFNQEVVLKQVSPTTFESVSSDVGIAGGHYQEE